MTTSGFVEEASAPSSALLEVLSNVVFCALAPVPSELLAFSEPLRRASPEETVPATFFVASTWM